MSVLKSKRKLSELEFYNTLANLRVELTQYLMNEKYIPKRWRPIISFPIIDKLRECMDYTIKANTIYPTNEHELQRRKDYQVDAIACIEQIYQELQYAFSVLHLNLDKLESILEKLELESKLLKGWKSSNKKIMKSIREKNKKANENTTEQSDNQEVLSDVEELDDQSDNQMDIIEYLKTLKAD